MKLLGQSALLLGRRCAIATLAATGLALLGTPTPEAVALEDSPKIIVDEVWQIVNNEFVGRDFDQEDWQVKRQELLSEEYSSHKDAYSAIREALRDLGDPYTRFLNPEQFADLTSQTTGELSGIGLRLVVDESNSVLTVVEALDESPAKSAGIERGDRILKINGQHTSLMTVEQAAELLQGEEGTEVTLQLTRPNQGLYEVTLTRAQVEVPVLHASIKEEDGVRVGYLKLDEFSSHAAEQMEKAIARLQSQDVQGFVLDLRGNPGGLLFASVDIARMWMSQGTIVRTVDRLGGNQEYSANNTALSDLPLVVLVDGNSASASEILAGALKDNSRATIVGTRTYGKGTVQSVHSLSDESGLAVTISRYYPPSGVNINGQGIAPDIELNLTHEQQRLLRSNPSAFGTGQDPQYRQALNVLESRVLGESIPSEPEPISIRQLLEEELPSEEQ
ncbi:S41 family peptidase [Spirulina sp. CS-785/01]|uniref:carboxyl-terminal processing protease CtpB n=1 Tax=Spirulina sp. CS-785/01 TaxID=3021716 RepID=UPI002330E4B3|nr:carboxyl-terminal processing protease CtpB [Spirulina sp. CS-785/01]MDB9312014.1 S41 family peptidase [Spirulina sp. CS-785/01]